MSAEAVGDVKRKRDAYATAACEACRKQKVKCELLSGGRPPCVRCQRRTIECILHTTARPTLDNVRHMRMVQGDVQNMHQTLGLVCQTLNLPPPPPLASVTQIDDDEDEVQILEPSISRVREDPVAVALPPQSPPAPHAPIDTFLESVKSYDITPHRSKKRVKRTQPKWPDIISKQQVGKEVARRLVERYLARLDHFVYGIASHHRSLDDVRYASPALLAAICAVSALHDAGNAELFETCSGAFRGIVADSVFQERDTEYMRALCIASFWLLDFSRILSSDAIRRAADSRLHRYFDKLKEPTLRMDQRPAARDRVRLWYLLFICDQHLSILHNRDCLTRFERVIVKERETFLDDNMANTRDIRIVSQISLLQIMCQVRDAFGSERAEPLPKSSLIQLNHFARDLEQYHTKYTEKFVPDPDIGDFPMAGLHMHYQFGKLYLGHHVFRGLENDPIPLHFLQAAYSAYEASMAIFTMLLDVSVLRENMVGVPHYFHVMIAFAGHLLLEVCMKHREQLGIMVEEDLRRISAVMGHFVQMPTLPQHPLTRVTAGLMRRLSTCTASLGIESVMTGTPFGTLPEPYVAALNPGEDPQFSFEGTAKFIGHEDLQQVMPVMQDPFAGFSIDDSIFQTMHFDLPT